MTLLNLILGMMLIVTPLWAESTDSSAVAISHCSEKSRVWDLALIPESEGPRDADTPEVTQVWIVSPAQKVPVIFDTEQESGIQFEPGFRNSTSRCDRTVAYALKDHRIVILLARDNPSNGVRLSLVLYDPVKNKVLGARSDLGSYRSPVQTILLNNTIWFETEESQKDSMRCPDSSGKKCPKIRGVEARSILDSPLPIWRKINLDDPGLRDSVDPVLTWKKSPVRAFYRDEDDFEAAFKYDATQVQYGLVWYRLAELGDDRICLFPTDSDRHLPKLPDQWLCRAL
jgi:hypothetical protein